MAGALLFIVGCASSTPPAPKAENAPARFTPKESPCGEDEVRQIYCDSLLPLVSAHPAEAPYEACPGYVDTPQGAIAPVSSLAVFSPRETEIARRRVAPGHSCCYSFCSKVQVANANEAQPAEACMQPNAVRESYCVRELETGTSGRTAGAPFERCPLAIQPPSEMAFSAPKAALLDPNQTAQRRSEGVPECCYGWCSKLPYRVWDSEKKRKSAED